MSATLRARVHRAPMQASNARHAWTERRWARVEIESDGIVGRGEAAPLPGYSQETLEACLAALDAIGDEALLDLECAIALPPAAEFALYTARREWWAQKRGTALCPVGTRSLATLGVDARHACFKRKVGRDVDAELRGLRALRDEHPEHALRLDANGALGLADARTLDDAIDGLGVTLFEEPVPFDALAELDLRVPVALDESLQHPDADERARRALGEGWAKAVVLKPTALGPSRCVELATLARAYGADVIVSHTFESPLGHAAACVLALELGTETPQGLGRYPLLDADTPAGLCGDGRLVSFEGLRYPVEPR